MEKARFVFPLSLSLSSAQTQLRLCLCLLVCASQPLMAASGPVRLDHYKYQSCPIAIKKGLNGAHRGTILLGEQV